MPDKAEKIPSVFREGYERALVMDPKWAEAYVTNTMKGDPLADSAVAALADVGRTRAVRLIQAGVEHREDALKDAPRELRDFFAAVESAPAG